jgi:serine protease Do
MKAMTTDRRARTGFPVLGLVLFAAVACGAAGAKGEERGRGPLKPESYDPRVSLAPLVEKVAPAVVNIRTKAQVPRPGGIPGPESLFEWFFGPRGPGHPRPLPRPRPEQAPLRRSMGSGFIIDAEGLVVTNRHVVAKADEIEVQLADDRTFDAEMVGSDERTDLALLKLKEARNLPTVVFGDSSALKVGDHVVAIGNPFGLDHTVTSGIVSAKERVIGAGPYDDFIQTDASINPGNSGGPLFNLRGEVVGINTAITPQGQGIGFAIPSDLARGLIDSLRREGKVVRGWLGITFQPLNDELAKAFGVKSKSGAVVANVGPGSPADKGGMKAGDIIVEVNGVKLKTARQLPTLVAGLVPGKTAPVTVLREGKRVSLKVTIGKMPEDASAALRSPGGEGKSGTVGLGIDVKTLDDETRRRLNAEAVRKGVLVSRVKPGSPASGVLRAGDIIVEANRKKVGDVSTLKSEIANLKKGDRLLLLIFRRGSWIYLVLQI